MRMTGRLAMVALCAALGSGAAGAETIVDNKSLGDTKQGANWLSYGRDYSEQRYSPLEQIDTENAGKLGLEWVLDLPKDRSLLSTPLVVDGVLYFTGTYSVARAVDAKTGKILWEYDPKVIEHSGDRLRIFWGSSRGLAIWKETVVIATNDGRLIGLDKKTGEEKWSTQTTDPEKPMYISGYPKAFDGKILVGNGGTEHGAARGYVSAYDAETGKQVWRFYVVPGNPADGFEDEAQEMAAKTWKGEWWKVGGGGNTWNGFTYDAEFDQILIGTGNGSPWNQKVRSPGGGDNLFLCSVVALDAKTGKYKWHYQTVPGETWDYNSSMDIVLADLEIDGKTVKAAMHAPKNGFYYVLDRKDGKLLSAEMIAKVNWATGIDMKTGRPIEREGARYEDGEELIWPSPFGAHNWHAMSYSPKLGLAFIPKIEMPAKFDDKKSQLVDWRSPNFKMDVAVDTGFGADIPKGSSASELIAWDPVKQKKVWGVEQEGFWNPGTMVTAGDVVFQGRADGHLHAYDAKTGKELWKEFLGSGISAPPVTYEVDGKQYVSILVGFGGAGVGFAGGSESAKHGWAYGAQVRRLFTFALDGKMKMPEFGKPVFAKALVPDKFKIDDKLVDEGKNLYTGHCGMCHGAGAVSGGAAPDLRASAIFAEPTAMKAVVFGGSKVPLGMPQFKELSDDDLAALQHFVRSQAKKTMHSLEAEEPKKSETQKEARAEP